MQIEVILIDAFTKESEIPWGSSDSVSGKNAKRESKNIGTTRK